MDFNKYILFYLNNRDKVWLRIVSWSIVFLVLLWWNRGLFRVSIFHTPNIFFNVFAFIQTVAFYYAFRFVLYPSFKNGDYLLLIIHLVGCYIVSCLIVCLPLKLAYFYDLFVENAYINQFCKFFRLEQLSDLLSKFTLLWYTTLSLWCNILTIIVFLVSSTYQSHQDRLLAIRTRDEMELSFLRSQIQPHFLFNTLNNIYGLLMDYERESEILLKLSDFMRYSLYTIEEVKPLKEELHFIQGYLDLECIRLRREGVDIEYELPPIVDDNVVISPLLISQFLELVIDHFGDENPVYRLHVKLRSDENMLQTGITFLLKNNDQPCVFNINAYPEWERRLELQYHQRHIIDSFYYEGQGSILLSLKLE